MTDYKKLYDEEMERQEWENQLNASLTAIRANYWTGND